MEEDVTKRTNYTISLEDFEFASLPVQFGRRDRTLPLWRSSNEEYYEIEIHETQEKDMNNQDPNENEIKITCHICDIEIPKAYLYEHNSGWKHQTCLKIAKNAMERVKKHIFQNDYQTVQPKDYSTYYCDTCALNIKAEHKENHERSKEHYLSKTHDALLENMLLLFAERDKKTQNSKTEIPIHSVNKTKTLHNIDESTDDEDSSNVSNRKSVPKKRSTKVTSSVAVDVRTNGFTQSNAEPKVKNTLKIRSQDKNSTAKKETVQIKTNVSPGTLPANISDQFNKQKSNTKDTLNINNHDKYCAAKKETGQMKTNVSADTLPTNISAHNKEKLNTKDTLNICNQDKYSTAKKETVQVKTNVRADALPTNISAYNKEKPNTKDTLNISNQDKCSTAKKETAQMKTNVANGLPTTVITQNCKTLPKHDHQNPEQVIDSNKPVESSEEIDWELVEEYENQLGSKIHSLAHYYATDFVLIETMDGASVKVHDDNYNGYGRIDGQMYCKMCRVVIPEESFHYREKQHVMKLMEPLRDGHCIRKIDAKLYHCVICNQILKDVYYHITSDYVHFSKLQTMVKFNQPIQNIKQETESLPQQSQTITATTLNQVTQSSQPTLNHRIQPLVNLNSVSTVDPNVSIRQPSQKLQPASVVKLPKFNDLPKQCSNQLIEQEETCVRIVSDNELFCTVCNRRMLIDHFQNHADGKSHKNKLEKLNVQQNTMKNGDEASETKIPEKPVAEECHYHFCQVCEVKVPNGPNCIQVHEEGKSHLKKLGKLNNIDGPPKNPEELTTSLLYRHLLSGNSEWMDLNDNPKEGTCKICKVIIPNKEANVREHLKGAAHTANLKKMLS